MKRNKLNNEKKRKEKREEGRPTTVGTLRIIKKRNERRRK